MARESLDAGFGLKDATPYNVMFDGPRPVFLDVLSFERRDPLDVLWRPYGQFVRSFVYPLLAARYCGVRVDELLLVHRDGIEPERMLRLCPAWRRWFPPFLGAVSIPALVSRDEQASGFERTLRKRPRGSPICDGAAITGREPALRQDADARRSGATRRWDVAIHANGVRLFQGRMGRERTRRSRRSRPVPAAQGAGYWL